MEAKYGSSEIKIWIEAERMDMGQKKTTKRRIYR
jgi:hypothetical protein